MGWHKQQQTKSNEPDNPVTLADMIHEGLSIFCWCNRCGHNSTVDPVPLTNVLGSFFQFLSLVGGCDVFMPDPRYYHSTNGPIMAAVKLRDIVKAYTPDH